MNDAAEIGDLAPACPGEVDPSDPMPDDSLPTPVHEQGYAGLLPLLQRLDARLLAAVKAADHMFASRAAGDLYRGLAISPADVAAAFGRVPGTPFLPLSMDALQLAEATGSPSLRRMLWLQRVYGLTYLDLDVILIALALEIDLRYERLYAYLHDDVTRRRPSVDLALNLLCSSAGDKLRRRERFAADAPLVFHRLIELHTDPQRPHAPLLARDYRLDEQIVRFILLDDSLDSRLAGFCELVDPDSADDAIALGDAQRQLLQHHAALDRPLRLYFHGPSECGQERAAALLAEAREKRILRVDLRATAATAGASLSKDHMHLLAREAWLRGALLHVQLATEDVHGEAPRTEALGGLWPALNAMPVDFMLEAPQIWVPAAHKPRGVVQLGFDYPSTNERQQYWQHCLEDQGVELAAEPLLQLARSYRLTYAQIRDAAAVAARGAMCAGDLPSDEDAHNASTRHRDACLAAARAQSGHELAALATRITPRAIWDDLILPDDQTAQLHELCDRFRYRDKVLHEWGFASKLSYGLGITALFSGGSGTGKTMAAEVIANALKLDLYRIDLAQVVSKYIGETEKNLAKIFTAAANANAILFFDEADALFGKRSEVKDSHDRYANLEISYLLQKMEQYEGIVILATNLRDNLDNAFTRRLAFSVHFPFPDEATRLQLWARAWPQAVPTSDSVNRLRLAHELKLAGGNIKNIALGVAFNAAGNGGIVDIAHMSEAVRREYQKMGRSNTAGPTFETPNATLTHSPKAG